MIQKKSLAFFLLVVPLLACSPQQPANTADAAADSSVLAETAHLHIFNWTDYVAPEVLESFQKKYRVTIQYDTYDSDETLEAKVLSGRSGYDLVAPSNTFIGRQIQAGAYRALDKNLIPNYGNINKDLLELMQTVDPDNRYAVPYFWGVNTLAINETWVKEVLGSDTLPEKLWDLAFNPEYTQKLAQCGISYLDSPAEMYPMALNYLGKPPNSTNAADLQAATDLMTANSKYVKRFTSSGYIDDLARGDMCVSLGFSGDLNIAKRRAEESGQNYLIRVLMPKEGVGVWVDSLVIPKDAANVLNAHRYIDYVLDAEIAAKNGDYVTYAPSSDPAKELMDKEFTADRSIFPQEEDLANSFIMVPLEPEMLKTITRQWQAVKSGK